MVRPARLEPVRFEPQARSGVTEECGGVTQPNEVGLVRPARLERATSWFVARRNEATRGSWRQLPEPISSLETTSDHWRPVRFVSRLSVELSNDPEEAR